MQGLVVVEGEGVEQSEADAQASQGRTHRWTWIEITKGKDLKVVIGNSCEGTQREGNGRINTEIIEGQEVTALRVRGEYQQEQNAQKQGHSVTLDQT